MKVALKQKRRKTVNVRGESSDAVHELAFEKYLLSKGLAGKYERHKLFIPGRRFKGDFVFEHIRLVVEVDGGEWLGSRGGHTSGTGYTRDRERDYLGLMSGWLTLRVTGGQVKSGVAYDIFDAVYERMVAGGFSFGPKSVPSKRG